MGHMQFLGLLKTKYRDKADGLYKEIKERVKSSLDSGASTILASFMGFVAFASGSNEFTQFLAQAGFTLLAEFLVNSKDKSADDLVEEIKNSEELKKELAKVVCEIVTDKDYYNVADKNWINSFLLDMRREVKDIEKVVEEAERRLTQILFNESGLRRLSAHELTDEESKNEFKEWLNGFSFGLAAIYHNKDYRREIVDDVKNKLEEKGRAIIVGESGTSKTTIWMRVICEYLKDGFDVLYNEGSEIDFEKAKDYIQSLGSDKVLIAVDNAHIIDNSPIYRLIYGKVTTLKIKYLLTIREPDFDRFVHEHISELDEPTREAIYKFQGELSHLRIEAKSFSKVDVKRFYEKYGKVLNDNEIDTIFRETDGNPIIVRFLMTGNGLSKHVRDRHDKFIKNDKNKIVAMLVCTLLDLGFKPADEDIIQKLEISQDIYYLDQATLRQKDKKWAVIHHLWALEWLSYLFNNGSTPNHVYRLRVQYLRDALDKISNLKNDVLILSSISSLFQASVKGKIDIYWLLNELKVDEYFEKLSDNKGKVDAYTLIVGSAFSNLGKNEEGIIFFDKSIELDPYFASAWSNKGAAFFDLGKNEEAIECIDKAIELNPYSAQAWNNKGSVFVKLGRNEKAIECADKAIELESNFAEAWHIKGSAYVAEGKHDEEAIKCFDKAIELNPFLVDAWHNKGVAFSNLNNMDEAIKCFDKAIEFKSNFAEAWNNKGAALGNLGKHEEAINCFDKAINLKSNYAKAWNNKGAAFRNLNRYEDAIKCYTKAYILKDCLTNDDIKLLHNQILQLAEFVLKFNCSNIDTDLLLVYSSNRIDKNLARGIIDELIKIDPDLSELRDELGLGQ
ncbi:MAG: tetratricopeptide repeat protein [Candidatus Methanoperedens sp.]|nr:tetratricopeptide repeat protein [Candidatus Methanoperedens sp.]